MEEHRIQVKGSPHKPDGLPAYNKAFTKDTGTWGMRGGLP